MSQGGSSRPTAAVERPPKPIHWRSWPLVDGGLSIWLWPPTAVAAGWAAGAGLGHWGWGAFTTACMLLCVWRMFVPVYFELNSEGIEVRLLGRQRRTTWRKIRGWAEYPRGAFLGVPRPNDPQGPLIGLYLPLPPHRRRIREKALLALEYHLGQPNL